LDAKASRPASVLQCARAQGTDLGDDTVRADDLLPAAVAADLHLDHVARCPNPPIFRVKRMRVYGHFLNRTRAYSVYF